MNKTAAALAAFALAAAPASAAPRGPALEPAGERIEGSAMRGGSVYWLLPALIVLALLIAILAGDEDAPKSP
ncbi:MAG TPA: hypothetical protein VF702_08830 [Allosphingosinicella sp.]|jgi:hypothetical protein